MKSFLFCFFVLQLALCSHLPINVSATPSKLVDEVCNKLVHIDGYSLTPDDCRSVFQRDPQSRTAVDYHALGLVLVNITKKAATEAIAGMKNALLHANTSLTQEENRAGQACIGRYGPAIPSLQATAESLRTRNYKLAQDNLFAGAYYAEGNCEDEVKADEDMGVAPYLSKFRTSFDDAVSVLGAMIDFLVITYCAN